MKTIRRDDGSRLALVSSDGSHGVVTFFAPNGYNGQSAAWILSLSEIDRLTDALDHVAVEIACQRGKGESQQDAKVTASH